MAPEIHEGADYNWAVDVYAYGMFVYVATTRLEPFPEFTNPDGTIRIGLFIRKVTSGGRPAFPPGFDSRWRNLIKACWQQEPKNCPTFQAIVDRLGSADFLNDKIDVGRFHDYQSHVLL
jgi:serine/threonine protein kinase